MYFRIDDSGIALLEIISNLTGPVTGNATETYEVFINGISQSFTTSSATKTLVQLEMV